MAIRDANEEDVERIAPLLDTSRDAVRGIIRDRTVRLCEDDAGVGIVSFDATPEAVHVTWLAGEPETYADLLGEPVRFGEREGLAVEMVVPEARAPVRDALEATGFRAIGEGPAFGGEATTVFRRATEGSDELPDGDV